MPLSRKRLSEPKKDQSKAQTSPSPVKAPEAMRAGQSSTNQGRSNPASQQSNSNTAGTAIANATNVFEAAAPKMVEEIIQGYTAYKKRLSELETLTASMNPKPDIIAVFSGDYSPGPDGKSWCGMCNVVAAAIKVEILPRFTRKGYLLWVRVGEPEEWMKRDNPFRTDKDLKLKSIPAAINWRTKIKLEGFPMISLLLVAELFEVDVEPIEIFNEP